MVFLKDDNMKNGFFIYQESRKIHIFIKANFNDSSINHIFIINIEHHFNRMIVSLIDFDVMHGLCKCDQMIGFRKSLTTIVIHRSLIHQIDIFYIDIKFMYIFPVGMTNCICIEDYFTSVIFSKCFELFSLIFIPRIIVIVNGKF